MLWLGILQKTWWYVIGYVFWKIKISTLGSSVVQVIKTKGNKKCWTLMWRCLGQFPGFSQFLLTFSYMWGFPCGSAGKESIICLQCGRPGFNPWVGKIPWRRERLPTPIFWPGEFCGLHSPWGRKEPDTTEWLSLSHVRHWLCHLNLCELQSLGQKLR